MAVIPIVLTAGFIVRFLAEFNASRHAIVEKKAVRTGGSKRAKSTRLWISTAVQAQKRIAMAVCVLQIVNCVVCRAIVRRRKAATNTTTGVI